MTAIGFDRAGETVSGGPKVEGPRREEATKAKSIFTQALGNSQDIFLLSYPSMLKDRMIDVIYNPLSGLTAVIHFLDAAGNTLQTSPPLPLVNMPKEMASSNDVSQLKRLFAHTHFIPEKGVDGCYNRVSIHVSGPGGGKSLIPFQPGLALGSVVRGDTLEKMEEYATKTAAREAREQQLKAIEERIEQLDMKIKAKKGTTSPAGIALLKVWKGEQKALDTTLAAIAEQMQSETVDDKIPIFESFYQGVETPIDTTASALQVQPRGFDSLSYSSQYISMKENMSVVHDRLSQSASSSQVNASGGGWFFSVQASHAWADATAKRLFQIQTSNISEGVLVISAVATTRHVRCFTKLKYDREKVRNVLEAMKTNDEKVLKRYAITKKDDDTKEIYLLTEAVLGGSFTAFVTFLDEQKVKRTTDKRSEEHSSATTVTASAGIFGWGGSGSYATSRSGGSQSEDDVLRGITTTKINIEIVSQGVMPQFTRGIIEHEIVKHLDLNPSKYELSGQDAADAKAAVTATGPALAEIVAKRQMKMSNAQVAILNTYRGLTSSKEELNLHTPDSVMAAYDDFAKQMASDQDCGIPIGFNYQILSERRLQEILEEMTSPAAVPVAQADVVSQPGATPPPQGSARKPEERKEKSITGQKTNNS